MRDGRGDRGGRGCDEGGRCCWDGRDRGGRGGGDGGVVGMIGVMVGIEEALATGVMMVMVLTVPEHNGEGKRAVALREGVGVEEGLLAHVGCEGGWRKAWGGGEGGGGVGRCFC